MLMSRIPSSLPSEARTQGMRWCVGVASAMALACGSSGSVAAGDAAVADSSDTQQPNDAAADGSETANDAALADAALADAAPDVRVNDGALEDAGPDAPACTPLNYPLPAPTGCSQDYGPPITQPGSFWVLQTEGMPPNCRSYVLAGSAACEDCVEHYNCTCFAPLLDGGGPFGKGTMGTGCEDTPSGPYFSQ
jgi:hypothetical protein